jgi:hypothetical protein
MPPDIELMKEACAHAVLRLSKSERGSAVASALFRFLDDAPVGHLDREGWLALEFLLNAYHEGFPATVMEALEAQKTQ